MKFARDETDDIYCRERRREKYDRGERVAEEIPARLRQHRADGALVFGEAALDRGNVEGA